MVARKLAAHKKSRQGCRNCRLRKIKCDEIKPNCKKCENYGVLCNYQNADKELELDACGVFVLHKVKTQSQTRHSNAQQDDTDSSPSLPPILEQGRDSGGLRLSQRDLELLRRFQIRISRTISTKENLPIWQNVVVELANTYPFLRHTLLSVTLMHDRHLPPNHLVMPSVEEAFHWSQAGALFKDELLKQFEACNLVALWASAALLGTMTFCQVDASSPEEVWPLKTPSPDELTWFRMNEGKFRFRRLMDGIANDPIYQALSPDRLFLITPITSVELESLPPDFVDLYGQHPTSTAETNPYHAAAFALVHALNLPAGQLTVISFLAFGTFMRPDFTRLLEEKDPRAILLMAMWYAKVRASDIWWMSRRARLEGQAICLYLERFYPDDAAIQGILEWPKVMLDLTPTTRIAIG